MNLKVRIAIISVAVNVVLVGVKLTLARWSQSTSILADAIHSLSDILVSMLVLSGLVLGALGQRDHNDRWRKVEDIVAIVVGLFILLAAVQIFAGAVAGPPRELTRLPVALAGIFLCILVSGFIARLKIKVGKEQSSTSLVADGYHSRMDMYSSIGVMVGLVGGMIGLNLDVQAAGLIALLIAATGLEVIYGGIRALLRGTALEEYWLANLFGHTLVGRPPPAGLSHRSLDLILWLRHRGRRLLVWLSVLVLLLWFSSGLYQVGPGERALVFRFGRLLDASGQGPGLRVHLPWPVERARKIPVNIIRRIEIGFRTQLIASAADMRSYQWESRHVIGKYIKKPEESIMFTGDENLIDVNTIVQYRVAEITSFLLRLEDPETLVRLAAEEAIRTVVGMETLDNLLTLDRLSVEEQILQTLQATLERVGSGIQVMAVKLQDVHPPIEVVEAFRDVASAREDKNRLINEAYAYRNEVLPRARGKGVDEIYQAEAQKQERINAARGEAEKFVALLREYQKAREVTEVRMFLETMEKALSGMEKFIVEPGASREPLDLRFFKGQPGEIFEGAGR
ncbi:FtsH protease activity modulator HflK [bacterium]|nr:FtsH protease activity modulator HflK [bacterium]